MCKARDLIGQTLDVFSMSDLMFSYTFSDLKFLSPQASHSLSAPQLSMINRFLYARIMTIWFMRIYQA